MALVWERDDLDPYERLVMLSLADHADDEGTCYPSISRLCKRTGMKERGVQNVVRRLDEKGLVRVAKNEGRKGANLYTLTPALNAGGAPQSTPAPDAPPHQMHPRTPLQSPPHPITCTPAPGAPEPSRNVIEPSVPPKSPTAILAEVAGEEAASEFVAHRLELKKPLTGRAAVRMANRLSQHSDPAAVLDFSIENGWQGIFPDRVKGKSNDAVSTAKRAAAAWEQSRRMDFGPDSSSVVPLLPARPATGSDGSGFG